MVKVLRKAGCEVDYNSNQTCCGQPAFNSGFWEEAKEVAEKWVADMAALSMPVVCPSASCVGFARNYMCDMDLSAKQYLRVKEQTFEFSEFLVNKLNVTDFGAKLATKAVYHDSCAALRECKIHAAPRKLLAQVQGLELLDLAESDQCCGFGGTFSVKFEPISVAMAEKKVENALAAGAEYIISGDLSCLMQLDGYIKNKKLPIKVMHIADVLCAV